MLDTSESNNCVWLVYDGDCPICHSTAHALRIRAAVGKLQLINARDNHPVVEEVKNKGLNLNKGMVVKFNNVLYHGADAMHILALIGTRKDWFNRLNVILFSSKFLSYLFYPLLRTIRNIVLILKRKRKINSTLCQNTMSSNFPGILQKQYQVFEKKTVKLKGELTVYFSKVMKFFLPFWQRLKILIPFELEKIPVEIEYVNNKKYFQISRILQLPNNKSYNFTTYVFKRSDSEVFEYLKFGFGVKFQCRLENNNMYWDYKYYTFKIFGVFLPLPLSYLIGKCYAKEESQSSTSFKMSMGIIHPLLGKIYGYDGNFKVI